MKKIIVLIAGILGGLQVYGINLLDEANDIFFYEDRKVLEDTRSRSIGPAVSARVNHDMGQIEIAFSEYLGVATIRVVDGMGMTISAYRCDTETEWDAYLPIPADAGAYKLIIDSSVAEYVGEFFIQ